MTARRVLVDASFDDRRGIAGLGVSFLGRPIAAEAVRAQDINEAEAFALLRGLTHMAGGLRPYRQGTNPGTAIVTDSRIVYERLMRGEPLDTNPTLLDRIRELAQVNGFVVVNAPRAEVAAADTTARAALRFWRAGAARVDTWKGG